MGGRSPAEDGLERSVGIQMNRPDDTNTGKPEADPFVPFAEIAIDDDSGLAPHPLDAEGNVAAGWEVVEDVRELTLLVRAGKPAVEGLLGGVVRRSIRFQPPGAPPFAEDPRRRPAVVDRGVVERLLAGEGAVEDLDHDGFEVVATRELLQIRDGSSERALGIARAPTNPH